MRWVVLGAMALSLAGCGQSAAEKAEAEYKIVEKNEPGYSERCAAASRVKDAWLAEGDEAKYQIWKATEYADCSKADRGG